MSTYLELCSDLRQESTDSGSGPTAVTGQSGELARFVKWVKDAWTELQNEHDDWRWMQKYFSVSTVSGTGAYAYDATGLTDTVSLAAITRFSRWHTKPHDFKCYLSSGGVGGEYFLQWMNWEDFKLLYRKGTQTNGRPVHVSVDETNKFVLGPIPNAVYVVSGGYTIGPQILAANSDTPEMPSRFHSLIVYRAMIKYGFNSVAPEALQRASIEGGRLHSALVRDQRPPISANCSLA